MKTIVTYFYKHKDLDIYVTNRPTDANPTIKYSTDKRDARKFDGTEDVLIDTTAHEIYKHTHTETDEIERVEL